MQYFPIFNKRQSDFAISRGFYFHETLLFYAKFHENKSSRNFRINNISKRITPLSLNYRSLRVHCVEKSWKNANIETKKKEVKKRKQAT